LYDVDYFGEIFGNFRNKIIVRFTEIIAERGEYFDFVEFRLGFSRIYRFENFLYAFYALRHYEHGEHRDYSGENYESQGESKERTQLVAFYFGEKFFIEKFHRARERDGEDDSDNNRLKHIAEFRYKSLRYAEIYYDKRRRGDNQNFQAEIGGKFFHTYSIYFLPNIMSLQKIRVILTRRKYYNIFRCQ
jgi:hypothetical protein